MTLLRSSLAALLLAITLEAQSAPPSTGTPRPPWQPRPVIIVDPNAVLTSPRASASPSHRAPLRATKPRPHPTPAHRFSSKSPPPELFERYDTRPSPSPPPRS